MKSLIDEKRLTINKKIALRLAIALLIHILLLSVFYYYANAQTKQSDVYQRASSDFTLALSPPTAYLRIQPGVSSMHTITVVNTGSAPITLTPEIVSFQADGLTGSPVLLEKLDFPYLDRTRTSLDTFTLQPNGERRVPLYFTIPGDATEAEFPVTVLFRKQPSLSAGAAGVGGVLGSNLIVLVSTKESFPAQFEISDWQTTFIVDSFGSLTARPILENTSLAAQVASGSAQITGPLGSTLTEYTMYSDVVLGASARQLRWVSENQTEPGEALTELRHKSAFLLGPYTIKVTINTLIEDTVQSQQFEYTIIALPISFIIAILAAGALVLVYRRTSKR